MRRFSLKEDLELLWEIINFLRVWVAVWNSTHVNSSLHLEESLVTPSSTPRVLNDPVVDSIFRTISYGKDSMVHILRSIFASVTYIYSRLIISETRNNLEGNWDWTILVKCLQEIIFTKWDVYRATSYTNGIGTWVNCALIIGCFIWVWVFSRDTSIVLNVFKGVRWETSITSMVVIGTSTINQLLLREIS